MHTIREDTEEFQKQLRNGSIQKAYRALLFYMMSLRTHFKSIYPDSAVSGLYQGYLDMTYFALFPPSLKHRNLKIAIVFNYEAFRFEAWLAGSNRQVQRQCWELFRESRWTDYRIVTPARGVDSIVECDLAKELDLGDPDALTLRIEAATAAFINDMERFLSNHPPCEEAEPGVQAMSPRSASGCFVRTLRSSVPVQQVGPEELGVPPTQACLRVIAATGGLDVS
jgi:hypothetical protein